VKKLLYAIVLFSIVSMMVYGCSGEDGAPGAQGPAGPPGKPQPIKVLILGVEYDTRLKNVYLFYVKEGFFPFGSAINYFNAYNEVPSLSFLKEYDAVLAFTDPAPDDPEGLGNVLADYVDAGGRVVVCPYATVDSWRLQGRIMTSGYCPFLSQSGSGTGDSDWQINGDDLELPLHPIFNGTDVSNLKFWVNLNIPVPVLDSGATVLAYDTYGNPAIAINSNGRVMAINFYPYGCANDTYRDASKVIANALLYLGGSI